MKPRSTLPSVARSIGLAKGRSMLAAVSILTGLACVPQASAVITFQFNYKDAAGTGFNDPAHPEYKLGLEDAATTTGSFFAHTATITMDVESTKTVGTNDLAAAGSTYLGLNGASAGFSPSVVQQKVITNGAVDLNGAEADGFVTVNLGQNYQYSPTAAVGADQYDFKGTMVHELAHALGFASNITPTPSAQPQIYTTFDSFLVNSSSAPLINPMTFTFDPAQTYTLTGGNNTLMDVPSVSGEYFSGPNERSGYDGKPIPIFSPSPYQPGSSGSHVDDNTRSTKYLLMASATETAGQSMGRSQVRAFGVAEEGILKDLGFTLASSHPQFATGEIGLQNKVYYLTFPNGNVFGYYSYLSDPRYLYHFDLGYEYTFEANDGNKGIYLYDFKSSGYFYTSPTFPFPYMYDFALNSVVYYYPDPANPGRYNTNGVRYFYVFNTGQIISK